MTAEAAASFYAGGFLKRKGSAVQLNKAFFLSEKSGRLPKPEERIFKVNIGSLR